MEFKIQIAQFKGEVTAELKNINNLLQETRECVKNMPSKDEIKELVHSLDALKTNFEVFSTEVSVAAAKSSVKWSVVIGCVVIFITAAINGTFAALIKVFID